MLGRLRRAFSLLNLFCAGLGAALLFMVAAIICCEVVIRWFGGSSQLWVIEVSEYALLFITFLGAPYLLEKKLHVVMDLVYDSLSNRWRRIFQLMNATIGFMICAVLTVVGASVVIEQYELGVRLVTVMRPQSWWITAALPVGMALMAVQFLDQIIRAMRREGV